MRKMEKGIIDRIEDGQYAVILIDRLQKEFVLPVAELPFGSKEGSIISIELSGSSIRVLSIEEDETIKAKVAIDERVDSLKKSSRKSRFSRN